MLWLITGSATFWLLTALPARILGGGDDAIALSGTAMLLCLVPGVGTLAWAEWTRKRMPQHMPIAVLGGTGVRMFVVLGTGLLLYETAPHYEGKTGFWIWILVFYLFTLALEIGQVLTGNETSGTGQTSQPVILSPRSPEQS
jgi:hypothetical protein